MRYKPRVVVLTPLRDFTYSSSDLFIGAAAGASPIGSADERTRLLGSLAKELGEHITRDPAHVLLENGELRQRLDKKLRFEAGLALVRERYALGKSLYEELRLEQAIDMLEGAEQSARELFADILAPELVSDIYLTLGLAQLDNRRPELAHISFKRMFLVTPERRFRRGYYPAATEEAFSAAITDLQASARVDLFADSERLEAFLLHAGADDAANGYFEVEDERLIFRLTVYSRQSRSFLFRDEFTIALGESNVEQLDRTVSRWFACAPCVLVAEGPPPPRSAFGNTFIDTAGSYGVYFAFPTREIFHNVGFSFNLAHRVLPQLDLFAKVSLYTAFADARQDLQDGSLTSVRAILGAGVAFETGIWRTFIRPGVELHYVGPFTVITNPSCKFWGQDDERCPPGEDSYREVDSALLGGVNLATGVALAAARGVYVTAQANFSLYFPLLEETDLNYLLGAELGLGYSF